LEEIPPEKRKSIPSNFRVRLKLTSDKNRAMYVVLKNKFNSFKGLSFRMCGRVEKVHYLGNPIAYIGVIRRSLKLWLGLNPYAFDEEIYRQKDASDKRMYEKVPMLVRIGSKRAMNRAAELVDILAQANHLIPKQRYSDKDLQLLAFTLKGNMLVKDKRKELLRQIIHVHDADVLTTDDAVRYEEVRQKAGDEPTNIATISLDVLDKNFLDGQKVTLEKLKKKGLVPEDCDGYSLTAGSRLTKPLYILADEYSYAAVKMIVLTGGRAIRIKRTNSLKI
jgi:ribosomal protein L15